MRRAQYIADALNHDSRPVKVRHTPGVAYPWGAGVGKHWCHATTLDGALTTLIEQMVEGAEQSAAGLLAAVEAVKP
jgi:hypothetical protein